MTLPFRLQLIDDRIRPLGEVAPLLDAGVDCLQIRVGELTTRELLAYALAVVALGSDRNVPVTINRIGSMLTPFFTESAVTDFASATTSDASRFGAFFHAMLRRGIYLPPSQYEAWFVSRAHGAAEIEATLAAADESFREIVGDGR